MATGSPLSLFFSVLNKPSCLALHVFASPCMCSCPVWWSFTELTGFSFGMELKAGHGIQLFWAFKCWIEWEIIISHDLLTALANTAQYEAGPYWRNHIQLAAHQYPQALLKSWLLASLVSSLLQDMELLWPRCMAFAIEICVVPLGPFLKLADAPQPARKRTELQLSSS